MVMVVMMNIADIMDPVALDRLVAEHYISRRVDPSERYTLYNYTEKATFDRTWTPETRQSRGLITDANGTIIAWPFDKFFNVDETPETSMAQLIARPGPIAITEKLDGSMIAVWYADGAWRCSTRGSFGSVQAIAAYAWLQSRMFGWNSALRQFTLLCEWCAPDNRVVLKYDTADCILIGARHTATGTDLHYEQLQDIANLALLRLTPYTTNDLTALAESRSTQAGMEGWVARWPDGFRVKIKTEEYLRLHRLVSSFSAARVRDVLLGSGDDWRTYLSALPEEFRAEAESMAEVIAQAVQARMSILAASYARLAPLAAESRKAYALAVQQEPAEDRPYLFSLLDSRPVEQKLLAAIDLTQLGFEDPVGVDGE